MLGKVTVGNGVSGLIVFVMSNLTSYWISSRRDITTYNWTASQARVGRSNRVQRVANVVRSGTAGVLESCSVMEKRNLTEVSDGRSAVFYFCLQLPDNLYCIGGG